MKKAASKDAVRHALTDAVERAARTGAIHAELRGRFLLGRSYQDYAELEESERWFRSAMKRARETGIPWAPYAFESRYQLAWVLMVEGRWDDALELLDLEAEVAPPISRAMLDALRIQMLVARGEDVSPLLPGLRKYWPKEGLVAIMSSATEMVMAGRRGDPAGVVRVYDDTVEVISKIWHPWFSARIRLAAVAMGAIAGTMTQLSADERATTLAEAERMHADGHTVLDNYADPSGFWGPEGRAWMKRLDAELLRLRWLAGIDAPPLEDLVGVWREALILFEDFGHLHEVAAVQTSLAGILRASGDVVAAREVADPARESAHRLGLQPLLDELRAYGSAPSRGDAASDALTPREQEILALVAEGRSNGEIGKQLFISAKTVSVHVSNILGKLGAAGRTEAAAIARRRGLV